MACAARAVLAAHALACRVLRRTRMAKQNDSWTIPLHVIEWSAIGVGFIMMLAIMLMHC